jgi:opacity protein-like surface antigen
MFRTVFAASLLAAVAAMAPALRAAQPDSAPALAGVTEWLHQIDAGKYGESWDAASSYFRGAVSRGKWIDAMSGVRKPLGSIERRFVKSADFRTSLPGAPDGEYFVIQFETNFEHKQDSVETVTAAKEGNAWKPAGYFIK